MRGGSHIAEKVSAAHGGERAADRRRDVVIARRDVRHQGAKNVERRIVAQPLFELHVRCNLVERHVPRPFHHDLDAALPRAVDECAEVHEFRNLCTIRRIGKAAGTQTIAQTDRRIVLLANIENIIEVRVERIFLLIVEHPTRDEGATSAHDVHDTPLFAQIVHGLKRQTAMQCHKVCSILRLSLNRLQDVIRRHLDHGAVSLDRRDRRLVERHRADHNRRMSNDAPPRLVDIVARREIHDGVRSRTHGFIELFQFRLNVRERARCTNVRIDLRAQSLADARRLQSRVIDVGADSDRSPCHTLANRLRRQLLRLRHLPHGVGDLALSCMLHLSCHNIPPCKLHKTIFSRRIHSRATAKRSCPQSAAAPSRFPENHHFPTQVLPQQVPRVGPVIRKPLSKCSPSGFIFYLFSYFGLYSIILIFLCSFKSTT